MYISIYISISILYIYVYVIYIYIYIYISIIYISVSKHKCSVRLNPKEKLTKKNCMSGRPCKERMRSDIPLPLYIYISRAVIRSAQAPSTRRSCANIFTRLGYNG